MPWDEKTPKDRACQPKIGKDSRTARGRRCVFVRGMVISDRSGQPCRNGQESRVELSQDTFRKLNVALTEDKLRAETVVSASQRLLDDAERTLAARKRLLDEAHEARDAAAIAHVNFLTTGELSGKDLATVTRQSTLDMGSDRFRRLSDLGLVDASGWTEMGKEVRDWAQGRKGAREMAVADGTGHYGMRR